MSVQVLLEEEGEGEEGGIRGQFMVKYIRQILDLCKLIRFLYFRIAQSLKHVLKYV